MENKEYYTPEIFELFVGWEGEVYKEYVNVRGATSEWVPFVYGKNNAINYFIYNDLVKLRCKYLCKQDIIDSGWEFQDVKSQNFNGEKHEVYKKGDLWFTRSLEESFIEIQNESKMLLRGYIKLKSKNEFQKLMKDYLNIPI